VYKAVQALETALGPFVAKADGTDVVDLRTPSAPATTSAGT
jgi:hypothetical protein